MNVIVSLLLLKNTFAIQGMLRTQGNLGIDPRNILAEPNAEDETLLLQTASSNCNSSMIGFNQCAKCDENNDKHCT